MSLYLPEFPLAFLKYRRSVAVQRRFQLLNTVTQAWLASTFELLGLSM